MFARVTRIQAPPDQFEAGVRLTREQTIPFLQSQPGYRGSYWLADQQAGKGLAISLWDSEEALRANNAALEQRRTQVSQATGATIEGMDVYEVLIADEPAR